MFKLIYLWLIMENIMTNSQKIIFAALGLSVPCLAFAYLDPGTGSILLQGLLAGLAAIAIAGKAFWYQIKSFFVRIFSGNKSKDE